MFQSYLDIDNDIIITSESDEATVNGYCQRISVKEILEYEKAHKKESIFKKIIKKLAKIFKKRSV